MGKRKARNRTLTKIDLSTLKFRPAAVSQHATQSGTRVTTSITPVRQPPAPPIDSIDFDLDPTNFDGEHSEDNLAEEDVSRAYYVTRVRDSYLTLHLETNCY